jgi:LuxR family transcriptional regulator, maltose regulon positive regulatory protein
MADTPPAANQSATVLLSAKLRIPPPRADLIARPRLFTRLDTVFLHRLLLLIAPAGFGKTSLLSSWIHWRAAAATSELPEKFAWLRLDERDNDPTRFWTYIVAALDPFCPGAGDHALAMVRSPQPPPPEVYLVALLEELAALEQPLILVLDDYHEIRADAVQASLAFFLEHIPPALHLLIAGRGEPPLSLARLRVRGQLAEIRAAELSFTPEECAALLQAWQVPGLDAAAIKSLSERTEGWAAALQLAALSLREQADPAAFIAAFAGSNRLLVDYLAEEVLTRQSAEQRSFLLRTAILDQLCAELCAAILGWPVPEGIGRARDMLGQLEQAGLFLLPLDEERRWYRYHQLFAEFARVRLAESVSGEMAALHTRAASWYAGQGYVPEAVAHALAGNDLDQAVTLIEAQARPLLLRSEVATVLSWLDMLPEALLQNRPGLMIIRAWALAISGQLDAAEMAVRESECLLAADPQPEDEPWERYLPFTRRNFGSELLAVRATVSGLRRDVPQTITLANQALAMIPADSVQVRSVVALMLGSAYHFSGDCAAATSAFQEAVAAARGGGNVIILMFALHQIGLLQKQQGTLRLAERTFRQALDEAAQHYPPRSERPERPAPVTGAAYVGLGTLAYEHNDLAAAERWLRDGIGLGRQGENIEILLMGPIYLARVQQARGETTAAEATMQAAVQRARRTGVARLVDWLHAEQSRLWLMQGRLAAATAWAAAADYAGRHYSYDDTPDYLREIDYMVLAQLAIMRGRPEPALPLLARMLTLAEQQARRGSVIELLALQACALHGLDRPEAALTGLLPALQFAAAEEYLRTLVDMGEPMRNLLSTAYRELAGAGRRHTEPLQYLRRLLQAFPRPDEALPPQVPLPALVETLSEREIEVLRLIAGGLSNQEIADRLIVGLSTVKKHINNAYGKLQVNSRTQALIRARELGLIN